jgi:hypothetical protein
MLVSRGPLAYCSVIKLAAIAAGGASIAEHVAGRGDAPRGLLPQGGAKITPNKKNLQRTVILFKFFLLLNYL